MTLFEGPPSMKHKMDPAFREIFDDMERKGELKIVRWEERKKLYSKDKIEQYRRDNLPEWFIRKVLDDEETEEGLRLHYERREGELDECFRKRLEETCPPYTQEMREEQEKAWAEVTNEIHERILSKLIKEKEQT